MAVQTQYDKTKVVRTPHPWRWLATALIVLLIALMIRSAAANPRFLWSDYSAYLFSAPVLSGLRLTLILTAIGMTLAIVIGVILAVMRMSRNPLLKGFSLTYGWLFRGTPILVQLIIFYNLSALYPQLHLSVPFGGTLWQANTNALISPLVAAILGLALHEAAYMSEIVRGGILSVNRGQWEAAMGIGMTRRQTFSRIVLPQSLKVILPPTFNQIIGMLKYTSLVSVLSLSELLYTTEQIYSQSFKPIPLLFVATTWYLICTSILMLALWFMERRLERDPSGRPLRQSRSLRQSLAENV